MVSLVVWVMLVLLCWWLGDSCMFIFRVSVCMFCICFSVFLVVYFLG